MNENVGEAVFTIRLDDTEAREQLKEWQQDVKETSGNGSKDVRSLSGSFDELTKTLTGLGASTGVFSKLSSGIGESVGAFNQYQAAMNGVSAVAQATGNSVTSSIDAVKEASAGGLITQADAAASIKNLELYGYSVEQATELIKIFTDSAVYNRQANYSVSEAVRVTTEGIRMENSVLSDASGITKNIAKMYEEYAAKLGKSTDALTSAEKQQAVYNGVLAEGGVFAGNAEEYTDTLAGSQTKLDAALIKTRQTLGAVANAFAPLIGGLADFISNNQEVVVGLTATIGILAGGAGLLVAINTARKALTLISQTMATFGLVTNAAKGGVVGLAVGIAAIGGAVLAASAVNAMLDVSDATSELSDSTQITSERLDSLKSSMISAREETAKLSQQLDKLNQDYSRDLKQIAVKHEESLASLTQQIEDANVDYKRAIDERMAEFNVTMAKQERSHQETVDELMTQLAFLQRYNNDYNKQKLLQVQFALAKEEELYKRETAAQQAEIELQNAADKEKLDKKMESLQQELDDELAFMNKHREALNSVRDVILLDEIESLQERHAEQTKALNEQIAESAKKGAEAADAYWNAYNARQNALLTEGLGMVKKALNGFTASMSVSANQTIPAVLSPDALALNQDRLARSGYASGGYTGRGAVDEVAGVVHKGEYVVPASQVDQSTGEPKLGVVQNFTINLSGTFATSDTEKRRVAQQIVQAIKQTEQARFATGSGSIG